MADLLELLQQALADRYRIAREPGASGMGTVHRPPHHTIVPQLDSGGAGDSERVP